MKKFRYTVTTYPTIWPIQNGYEPYKKDDSFKCLDSTPIIAPLIYTSHIEPIILLWVMLGVVRNTVHDKFYINIYILFKYKWGYYRSRIRENPMKYFVSKFGSMTYYR